MSFYGTVVDADAYHLARGNTEWKTLSPSEKELAMTRASDYLDRFYVEQLSSGRWASMWCGSRTAIAQPRVWPRDNVTLYGEDLGGNVTPIQIEEATYEGALREATTPGYLLPDFTRIETQGPVVQETVGPLTVKYADLSKSEQDARRGNRPPNLPVIPAIDGIVAGLICSRAEYPAVRVV